MRTKMPWWFHPKEEMTSELQRLIKLEWCPRRRKRFEELLKMIESFHEKYPMGKAVEILGYALLYRPGIEPDEHGCFLEAKMYAVVAWGLYGFSVEAIDIEEWLEAQKPTNT